MRNVGFRIAIRYQIQGDTMLQPCLERGEDERETPHGVQCHSDDLLPGPLETGVGDLNEGGFRSTRGEPPLDGRRGLIPFDENS